jgi:imidazolonepropionase-like amidohydrolase
LQPFKAVLAKEIPLVADVNQADAIGNFLRLQREFEFRLVVYGGEEAHLVAGEMAAAAPPVSILMNMNHRRHDWESVSAFENSPGVLKAAGVKIGLGIFDPHLVRGLRWEAGLFQGWGLNEADALAGITSNAADIMGLPHGVGRIVAGTPANFVLLNGAALSLQSEVQIVAAGRHVQCRPVQD